MVCRVCKGRFEPEELGLSKDRYPYGDSYCEQVTAAVCPSCGSSDVVSTRCCTECGGDFETESLHDGLCDMCKEELMQTLDWAWSLLSPAQKRWAAANTLWMDS